VRLEDALAATSGKLTLMGNINNPQLLLKGSPAEVAQACRAVIHSGVQILAPECAVPLTTPLENLETLVEVAEHESP
jgi:uroporphyrinogen-III decarboxylase